MDDAYELRSVTYRGRVICYELVGKGKSVSELERMLQSPKTREQVMNLLTTIDRIGRIGIQKACETSKLRLLRSELNLYEIKNYAGSRREMSCIVAKSEGDMVIVLLFSFVGHRGSAKIEKSVMKRAEKYAECALGLLSTLTEETR